MRVFKHSILTTWMIFVVFMSIILGVAVPKIKAKRDAKTLKNSTGIVCPHCGMSLKLELRKER